MWRKRLCRQLKYDHTSEQLQGSDQTAKSKANTVTVASICPRGDQTTQDPVDTVNAGI